MTNYRPDIDGLRAVAVLSVIAFHLNPAWLPGGYLGVDIFFVISGYLITNIIWREACEQNFSILRFYERRIRRIMPALLTVLAATSVAALILLLPADLKGFGRSLLATLFFVANIYFWRDTNYFSRTAEDKPLLHMWSLGIEEQFYIVMPFLLAILAFRWRRAAVWFVLAIVLLSFGLNVFANRIGAQNPAFYLLPTRAWELGAGAAIALLPASLSQLYRPVAFVAGLLGIALLLLALTHPQQGLIPAATPAIVAAALLIWSGSGPITPATSQLLALRPFVLVGLISYSLYLWHWPVIVFSKYYLVRQLNVWEVIAALAVMFTAAFLSYRYIEQPARAKTMSWRRVGLWTGAGSLAAAGLAITIVISDGFPGRLDAQAAAMNEALGTHYRCPVLKYLALNGERACELNLPSRNPNDAVVVLMGNSHAQMYAPVIEAILRKKDVPGLLVPVNGCFPSAIVNLSRACAEQMARNIRSVSTLQSAKTILLGTSWNYENIRFGQEAQQSKQESFAAGLDHTIRQLKAAGKKVVLIGPIPAPGWDVPSVGARSLAFGRPLPALETSRMAFDDRYGKLLETFVQRQDLEFVQPHTKLCNALSCPYIRNGRSLFADSNHLAAIALPPLKPLFEFSLDH